MINYSSKNGVKVFIHPEVSCSHRPDLDKEVISKINIDGCSFIRETINLGRVIGKDYLVETEDTDEIVYYNLEKHVLDLWRIHIKKFIKAFGKGQKGKSMKKNDNGFCCVGCKGNLHCYNSASPCFTYFCGQYPGTGPRPRKEQEEKRRKH